MDRKIIEEVKRMLEKHCDFPEGVSELDRLLNTGIIDTKEIRVDAELKSRIARLPQPLRHNVTVEIARLADVVAGASTRRLSLIDLFMAVSKALINIAEDKG